MIDVTGVHFTVCYKGEPVLHVNVLAFLRKIVNM